MFCAALEQLYVYEKMTEFSTLKAMYWDLNAREKEEDYLSEDVRHI
jgi:hypothetical protein